MSCSGNSNASTSELSGQFVSCAGVVEYAVSPVSLNTRWYKEGEAWKLLWFGLSIQDVNAYADLVAAEKAEAEEESGTPTEE